MFVLMESWFLFFQSLRKELVPDLKTFYEGAELSCVSQIKEPPPENDPCRRSETQTPSPGGSVDSKRHGEGTVRAPGRQPGAAL